MRPPLLTLIALLLVPLSACRVSASTQLENMYLKLAEDSTVEKTRRKDAEQIQRTLDRSVERTRKLLAEGEIQTPQDAYHAAFILYESPLLDDVMQAQELALDAYEGGVEDAIRVAAHCMDRSLMMRELPQTFGTQFVFEPVLMKWRVWDVDPSTTDAERQAFNLPPLAELRARVDEVNERLEAERAAAEQ